MYRLSGPARLDLLGIVQYWIDQEIDGRASPGAAGRVADRLHEKLLKIARGTAIGRRRPDIAGDRPWLFVTETPWVIAYHASTKEIAAVLDGRRDLPRLFGFESAGSDDL